MRQADAFLRGRGTSVEAAPRADLEAFMADLLARRAASTAATYHKVLKILFALLAEEEELSTKPMAGIKGGRGAICPLSAQRAVMWPAPFPTVSTRG